jgi:hypothetical protein
MGLAKWCEHLKAKENQRVHFIIPHGTNAPNV